MVDQVTHNSVRVRWTKPAESSAAPISRYTIWTRTRNAAGTGWIVDAGSGGTTDAQGWIRRGDVRPGNAISHTLTGLPSGVLQEVRLSARADRTGESTLYGDSSAPVQFTTAAANLPGAPAAPTVSTTAASSTSLDVSWSAPANTGPAITGYDLQYRAGTSGGFTAGPQGVTGTSAAIGSLQAGTSYQVQVRATNAVGNGGWSASGTGTTRAVNAPARPAQPTFGTATENSIVVNWLAPANTGSAITDYDVQYREVTTPPPAWTDAGHSGTERTVTLTGLTAGTAYEVQVRATNGEGTGDWSPSSQFTAAANSPPAFTFPAGETSYSFTLAENADGSGTAIELGTVYGDRRGRRRHGELLHRGRQHGQRIRDSGIWCERRHHWLQG